MKTIKQWMILTPGGELYSASNAALKTDCIERHYSDLGETWGARTSAGDKLVRVEIKIIKTYSK